MVRQSRTLQSAPPGIPSTHLAPHIITTILLTMFPMLYFIFHDYSVTTSLYFSIPSLFSPSHPNPNKFIRQVYVRIFCPIIYLIFKNYWVVGFLQCIRFCIGVSALPPFLSLCRIDAVSSLHVWWNWAVKSSWSGVLFEEKFVVTSSILLIDIMLVRYLV